MQITIEDAGRRVYLVGNTYAIKDALKEAGGHWDANRRAWWLVAAKRDIAEGLAGQAAEAQPQSQPQSRNAEYVAGRAEYQGRSYYVAGRVIRGRTHYDDRVATVTGAGRTLLVRRDGQTFWADSAKIHVIKTYDRPQTVSGLRRYAEQLRKSGDTPELAAARRHGWDGKIGSPSYYTSGAFDEIDQ